MKKFFWLILITFIFVHFSCSKKTDPLIPPEEGKDSLTLLVEELNSIVYPLSGASPELNDDDLQVLSFLGDAKIVGLGEATHGTKEFFQLKHRIFKYLVENHGFRIFGFECDMGESIYIDRYINGGEGDINEIMRTKMHFWTWRTVEVRELLEWMRSYNTGKPETDRLHFVGFDCQFMTYQTVLIEEYFSKTKPEFLEEITPFWSLIKEINIDDVKSYYSSMDNMQRVEINKNIDSVIVRLNVWENDLLAISSPFEYNRIKRLIRNIQQSNDMLYLYYSSGGMLENEINYRDFYMAENAKWLSEILSSNAGVVLWAHNMHIGNIQEYSMMGYYLKQKLGIYYQTVGFSFSKGTFMAITITSSGSLGLQTQSINSEPLDNSLNQIFYNARYDNFILNLSDIQDNSEMDKWLSGKRKLLTIGASYNGNTDDYYYETFFGDIYNVMINYDNTTAAVQLQNSKSISNNVIRKDRWQNR